MSNNADKDSKTEMPTAKRLDETYKEGSFPKAEEISMVFVLAASFGYLSLQGPAMAAQVQTFSAWILGHLHAYELTPTSAGFLLPELLKAGLFIILPFILVCAIAAYVAGGLQTGFRLTPDALKFKPDKLNPINGFMSLFNFRAKLVASGITFLKFLVVAWVLWSVLGEIKNDPIFYTSVSVMHIVEFIFKTFMMMLWQLILTLAVIAALNYAYQKWQFMDNLKMTKQEVEDEMRNSEGNPQIKGKRRRMAYQNAYRQILTKVPLADVVVTNPTHFAVALKYERGKDAAPVVLAKGKDLLAQRIKQIAAQHDVPMVENRPVARALYKGATVGKSIPAGLYQAVAQILAYVYRAHRYYFHRLKARRLEAQA